MSDEDEITLPERGGARREGDDIIVDDAFERAFADDVAALPPSDQLSGHDARRALVVKMVAAGTSISQAARMCGVSRMVAYKACSAVRKGRTIGSGPSPLHQKQEMLVEMALDGAIMANEKLLEMMERDDMRPAEMVKAYQTLQNTVMKRFNWGDDGAVTNDRTKNALAGALDALREGAKISIEASDPAEKAEIVDVEVVRDEG